MQKCFCSCLPVAQQGFGEEVKESIHPRMFCASVVFFSRRAKAIFQPLLMPVLAAFDWSLATPQSFPSRLPRSRGSATCFEGRSISHDRISGKKRCSNETWRAWKLLLCELHVTGLAALCWARKCNARNLTRFTVLLGCFPARQVCHEARHAWPSANLQHVLSDRS